MSTNGLGMDRGDRTVFRLSAADLDEHAGRQLTDDELDRVRAALDRSTLPDVVGEVVYAVAGDTVDCKFCGRPVAAATAHRHGGGWVGDGCCWDERLRTTE